MVKRIAVGALWALALWVFGALAAFFLGMPGWVVPVGSAGIGLFVAVDPAGWLWRVNAPASTSPRPEYASIELDPQHSAS